MPAAWKPWSDSQLDHCTTSRYLKLNSASKYSWSWNLTCDYSFRFRCPSRLISSQIFSHLIRLHLDIPSAKTENSHFLFQPPGLDMPIYQLTWELNCMPWILYWDKSSQSLVFSHLQKYLWIAQCCFATCTPQISSNIVTDLSWETRQKLYKLAGLYLSSTPELSKPLEAAPPVINRKPLSQHSSLVQQKGKHIKEEREGEKRGKKPRKKATTKVIDLTHWIYWRLGLDLLNAPHPHRLWSWGTKAFT